MRIIHISDFHFTKLTANPLRLFPKRIFSHLNWLLRRKKEFDETQVENLPALFEDLNVDLVLFGGDFSSSSMPEEFKQAKTFVQRIKSPWIAIPGNHDQYTVRSYQKKRFFESFANKKPDLASLKKEGVEAHKISKRWWVVAMDTAKPTCITSSEGTFSKALEAQLEHLLGQIPKDDKIILLNHYPFFAQEDPKKALKRGEHLEKLLRRHSNISLYLHGHTHRHSIADLRPDGLPIVLDSGSCSLKNKGTWNLIDLEPAGCTVSTYHLKGSWEKENTQEFAWKTK